MKRSRNDCAGGKREKAEVEGKEKEGKEKERKGEKMNNQPEINRTGSRS